MGLDNIINPLQLTNGQLSAVAPTVPSVPLDSTSVSNLSQQLLQTGANTTANELTELTAGFSAIAGQYTPFLTKKLMTFFLLNQDGTLVQPTDGSFQAGYLFNMLINPSSFQINYPTKTINPVRTMGGWVIQHWYPELGSIAINGIIGNLLQANNNDIKSTPNWVAFTKLIRVYQNNGIPYQIGKVPINKTQFNPTAVIVYDNVTYNGYFETFEFTEDQDNPWTRNYTIAFKFTDMFDTSNIAQRTSQGASTSLNAALANPSIGGSTSGLGNLLNPQ